MASYRFRCSACGKEDDRTIAIANYDAVAAKQRCACGGPMTRVIVPPMIATTGRWRDKVASIGPSEFMRRETQKQSDRE